MISCLTVAVFSHNERIQKNILTVKEGVLMRTIRKWLKNTPLKWKITGSIVALPIVSYLMIYICVLLLGPPSLAYEENTIFYDMNEEMIGEESGAENRQPVSLDEVSPSFIDALILTEDQHFFSHNGFDLKRIAAAALSDIKSLSLKQGASTITQQYARNLYLTHDKTWTRKLKEAFFTMRLEHFYSKEELLTGYINTIYFGHGAHGIEAASMHFFNKHAGDLTIAESVMLAGIPKGPTYYSPRNDEEKATERQQLILERLHKADKISDEEFGEAQSEKLVLAPVKEKKREAVAPHFQDIALQEAAHILDISESNVRSGGYRIYTTLNRDVQNHLDEEVQQALHDGTDIEGGAISMDPRTGGVRALIGGKSYDDSHFNRAVHAKRMAGSTMKPMLYYAALDHQFTPSTKLISEPTTFQFDENESYKPRNYNGYYANEPVTLAQALALSDNIYAVKTHLFIGPSTLAELGETFGITSELPEVPSLALGTASISLIELVTAYSHIANYGKEITNHTIETITDARGNILYERSNNTNKQVFDENKMAVLTSLLTGMFNPALNGYMEVTGTQVADDLTHTYAGKSGSTSYDSWMIGFSPTLVTGVWVGFDDHRAIEKTSHTTFAKEIWANTMEKVHHGQPSKEFPIPSGSVEVAIDPASGLRSSSYCSNAATFVYEKGTEPNEYCPEHPIEDDESPDGIFKRLFDLF